MHKYGSFTPTPPPQEGGEEEGGTDECPPPLSVGVNLSKVLARFGVKVAKDEVEEEPMAGTCETMWYPPQPNGGGEEGSGGGDYTYPVQDTTMPFEYRPEYHVQQHTRAAAGIVLAPGVRRTPRALDESMKFLTNHILREPDPSWVGLYKEKFDYLWNRFRQIRQDWVAEADSTHRRKKWGEFMIRVHALRLVACSRNPEDCAEFLPRTKKLNAEALSDTFSQLTPIYRKENKKRNSEMIAAVLLFHGLKLNAKLEAYAGWLKTGTFINQATGEELHGLEDSQYSVELAQVYKELDANPAAAESTVVSYVMSLLHCLHDGEWLRFFSLLRSLELPFIARCLITAMITYVRFRAIYDLFNVSTYFKRFRGAISLDELTYKLMFDSAEDCELFCKKVGFPLSDVNISLSSGEEVEEGAADPGAVIRKRMLKFSSDGRPVLTVTELSQRVQNLDRVKQKVVFPMDRNFLEWDSAMKLTPELEIEAESQRQEYEAYQADRAALGGASAAEEEEEGSNPTPPVPLDDCRSPQCPIDYMFFLEQHFPPNLTFTHLKKKQQEHSGEGSSLTLLGGMELPPAALPPLTSGTEDETHEGFDYTLAPKDFDDFALQEATDSSSCATSASGIYNFDFTKGNNNNNLLRTASGSPKLGPERKWRIPGATPPPKLVEPVVEGEEGDDVPANEEDSSPKLPTFEEYISKLLEEAEEAMSSLRGGQLYDRRVQHKKEAAVCRTLLPQEEKARVPIHQEEKKAFTALVMGKIEEMRAIDRLLKARAKEEEEEAARKRQEAEAQAAASLEIPPDSDEEGDAEPSSTAVEVAESSLKAQAAALLFPKEAEDLSIPADSDDDDDVEDDEDEEEAAKGSAVLDDEEELDEELEEEDEDEEEDFYNSDEAEEEEDDEIPDPVVTAKQPKLESTGGFTQLANKIKQMNDEQPEVIDLDGSAEEEEDEDEESISLDLTTSEEEEDDKVPLSSSIKEPNNSTLNKTQVAMTASKPNKTATQQPPSSTNISDLGSSIVNSSGSAENNNNAAGSSKKFDNTNQTGLLGLSRLNDISSSLLHNNNNSSTMNNNNDQSLAGIIDASSILALDATTSDRSLLFAQSLLNASVFGPTVSGGVGSARAAQGEKEGGVPPKRLHRRLTREERRAVMYGQKSLEEVLNPDRHAAAREAERNSRISMLGEADQSLGLSKSLLLGGAGGRSFGKSSVFGGKRGGRQQQLFGNETSLMVSRIMDVSAAQSAVLNSKPSSLSPANQHGPEVYIPCKEQDISSILQWEVKLLQQAAMWYRALPAFRKGLLMNGDGSASGGVASSENVVGGAPPSIQLIRSQAPTNLLIDHYHGGRVQLHTPILLVGDMASPANTTTTNSGGGAPLYGAVTTSRSVARLLCDPETEPILFPLGAPAGLQKIKSRGASYQLEPTIGSQVVQSTVEVLCVDHNSLSDLQVHGVSSFNTLAILVVERNIKSVDRARQSLEALCHHNSLPGSGGHQVTQGILLIVEDRADGDLISLLKLSIPSISSSSGTGGVPHVVIPLLDIIADVRRCGEKDLVRMTTTKILPPTAASTLIGGGRLSGKKRSSSNTAGQLLPNSALRDAVKTALDDLVTAVFEQNRLIADVGTHF